MKVMDAAHCERQPRDSARIIARRNHVGVANTAKSRSRMSAPGR